MPSKQTSRKSLSVEALERIDQVCLRFEHEWQLGNHPKIESFLVEVSELDRRFLESELLLLEFEFQQKAEEVIPFQEYRSRFPDQIPLIDEVESQARNQTTAHWNPSHLSQRKSQLEMREDQSESLSKNETRLFNTTLTPVPARGSNLGVCKDYELIEEIARGGMGVIYKAWHCILERVDIVKMIRPESLNGEEAVKRFQREVKAAAHLKHPNIVMIYEVGMSNNQPYYAMEYVAGENLSTVIRRENLTAKKIADLMRSIARAVHHAHEKGILHRDLKPANILVDHHFQVKVTDFGLAKRLGNESNMTMTGQVMGTSCYMPPEQARGDNSATTERSDVYSLGATLYEMLTGRPPFQGETFVDTLHKVVNETPVAPRQINPKVPRDLETICLKCLEKDPQRRYESAEELACELDRYLDLVPIGARPVSVGERFIRWCQRDPLAATLIGVVCLLLMVTFAAVGMALRAHRNEERSTATPGGASMRSHVEPNRSARLDEAPPEKQIASLSPKAARGGNLVTRNPPKSVAQPTSRVANLGIDDPRIKRVCELPSEVQHQKPQLSLLLAAEAAESMIKTARNDPRGLSLLTQTLWTRLGNIGGEPLGRLNSDAPRVAISPDDHWLALNTTNGLILWNLEGTPTLQTLTTEQVVVNELCLTPDSSQLIAVTPAKIQSWPTTPASRNANKTATVSVKLETFASKSSPDRKWLVTLGPANMASVWNLTDASLSAQKIPLETNPAQPDGNRKEASPTIQFSPDSNWVLVSSRVNRWTVWRLASDKRAAKSLHLDRDDIARFSPAGNWLVTGNQDEFRLRLYPLTESLFGEEIVIRRRAKGLIDSVFSPDSRWLISQSEEMFIWDLNAEIPASARISLVRSQGLQTDPQFWSQARLAVSNDRLIVFSPAEKRVSWWKFSEANPLRVQKELSVNADATGIFSPDGQWFACQGSTGRMEVVDFAQPLPQSRPVTYPHHSIVPTPGKSDRVFFTSTSNWLVRIRADRVVETWEPPYSRGVRKFPNGHDDPIEKIFAFPSSHWLVTASRSQARLWNVKGFPSRKSPQRSSDLPALVRFARKRAGRSLTDEERSEFSLAQDSK